MNIKKLKITVFLKQDIKLPYMYEFLSNYINGAMKNNQELKQLHTSTDRYKFYTFCGLYPLAVKGIYKQGNLYSFYLTSCNSKYLLEFEKALKDYNDDFFVNCSVNEIVQPYKSINNLTTITPCVITYNNRSLKDRKLLLVRQRVISNLINKYNTFFKKNINLDYDFIEELKITNNKPIRIKYKKSSLLGFKLYLTIKEDEISQTLARFALQCGLLEKNSLGLGHCFANVKKE